jgi:hypothetical protein
MRPLSLVSEEPDLFLTIVREMLDSGATERYIDAPA